MKTIKTIITVAAMSLTALSASAQSVETAYFNDGFQNRHDLNPAFGNDNKGYIAMPFLGNINFTMNGNLGVDKLLFKGNNGKTLTFLHPDVTADQFLGGINSNNKINEELHMQILGCGFKGFGGYNTIEINLREDFHMAVSGSVLELAKTGLKNQTYDLSGLGLSAQSYAEIGLGHSRQIDDNIRVGAKVKFLIGLAAADLKVNDAQITLGTDGYTGSVDAEFNGSIKGMEFKSKTSEYQTNQKDLDNKPKKESREYINDLDLDNVSGPNGFGMAFDFGAEYKIDDNWKVSMALLDLGWITWSENHKAVSHGSINTNDYVFSPDQDAWNTFGNMGEVLADDLTKMVQLKEEKGSSNRTTALGATLNIGGEYIAPFYDKLSFGALSSTRINGDYTWTNFRLSANVKPVDVFSASASLACGTYGWSFGGILNFHCKGFNVFVASDHFIGKMAKQGVPLSSNGSFSMGVNFPL